MIYIILVLLCSVYIVADYASGINENLMIISLIAILTVNNVIGRENTIPWYFSADIHWFKNHTLYKPIIMGRKTFESIGKKPLSDRLNIVLSRNRLLCNNFNNIIITDSLTRALSVIKESKEVMIIGGSSIYNTFINQCSRMYLTYINLVYDYGDVWFPCYDKNQWNLVFDVYTTENHIYNTCYFNLNFKILERCLY